MQVKTKKKEMRAKLAISAERVAQGEVRGSQRGVATNDDGDTGGQRKLCRGGKLQNQKERSTLHKINKACV